MTEQRITFATAFYPIQSKFPSQKYIQWATHLFSIVCEFYLVVFTDEATQETLLVLAQANPYIRIVVRPWSSFNGMKYVDFWKKNHEKNHLLKRTCWELNMLWNEKVWFVNEIIQTRYFPETEYYGWMDIGYFRNEPDNIHTSVLTNWGKYNRLVSFSVEKVHYTLVNPLGLHLIRDFKKLGGGIPLQQTTVAGGFFFGGKEPLLEWRDIFTTKLEQYVSKGMLLRDDQIIIVDCIMDFDKKNPVVLHEGNRQNCFCFHCNHGKKLDTIYRQNRMKQFYQENSPFPLSCFHSNGLDDWFLFQRLL